jgi:hypothetical protein
MLERKRFEGSLYISHSTSHSTYRAPYRGHSVQRPARSGLLHHIAPSSQWPALSGLPYALRSLPSMGIIVLTMARTWFPASCSARSTTTEAEYAALVRQWPLAELGASYVVALCALLIHTLPVHIVLRSIVAVLCCLTLSRVRSFLFD